MAGLAIATLLLAGALFVALVRSRRCGWRHEAMMGECEVVGTHRYHVITYDEFRYNFAVGKTGKSYRSYWEAAWVANSGFSRWPVTVPWRQRILGPRGPRREGGNADPARVH